MSFVGDDGIDWDVHWEVQQSGFEFLRSTPEGDPRNGFVVRKRVSPS